MASNSEFLKRFDNYNKNLQNSWESIKIFMTSDNVNIR